ncbi:MAG TPA: nitrite reductase small subunit NirD [Stellaceae bacterium]|nr:nitrite reductase small subunit NirD [Stellaceae bacterium]
MRTNSRLLNRWNDMPRDWIEIGGIDDIPTRGARTVRTSGNPVAVFRTANDEIFALIDRCPHRGGPLSEGIVSGKSVACPLHNWVIDLDSGHAQAPDVGCAPSIPVKLAGRRIFLAASAFVDEPASIAANQGRAA